MIFVLIFVRISIMVSEDLIVSPKIRVVSEDLIVSPKIRVVRGDLKISPKIRVVSEDLKISPKIRVVLGVQNFMGLLRILNVPRR
jgi:hypothetical protein